MHPQSLLKLLLADARASEDPTKLPGPLHKALVAEYRRRFGSDAAAAEQLCQLAEQILRECVGVETNKAQCRHSLAQSLADTRRPRPRAQLCRRSSDGRQSRPRDLPGACRRG